MKMMLPDVIGHENQSQHCPDHRCFMFGVIRTDYHPDAFSYHTDDYRSTAAAREPLRLCNINRNRMPLRSEVRPQFTHAPTSSQTKTNFRAEHVEHSKARRTIHMVIPYDSGDIALFGEQLKW